jgi:hypothetical protein
MRCIPGQTCEVEERMGGQRGESGLELEAVRPSAKALLIYRIVF